MITWQSILTSPMPIVPAGSTGTQYLLPAGQRAILEWLAIALVTSSFPYTRHIYWPYKLNNWDPIKYSTSIATQAASLTNYYFWGIGMPYSDGINQVYRTFPLAKNIETNSDLIAEAGLGDTWVNIFGLWWNNDRVYAAWSYRVVQA